MERRSFPYEEDRWRVDNLTGVSVTRGGKTVRLGDETACCEGGGEVVVVIVAVIGFAGGKKRKGKKPWQKPDDCASRRKRKGISTQGDDGGWGFTLDSHRDRQPTPSAIFRILVRRVKQQNSTSMYDQNERLPTQGFEWLWDGDDALGTCDSARRGTWRTPCV